VHFVSAMQSNSCLATA